MKKNKFLKKTFFIFLFSLTLTVNQNCAGSFWDNWLSPTMWKKTFSNAWDHVLLKPSMNLVQDGHTEWNQINSIEDKIARTQKSIQSDIESESLTQKLLRLQETDRCLARAQHLIETTKGLIKAKASYVKNPFKIFTGRLPGYSCNYPTHDKIAIDGIVYNDPKSAEQLKYLKKLTTNKANIINDLDSCINQIDDPELKKTLQSERDIYKQEFNSKKEKVNIEQIKYYAAKLLESLPGWVKFVGGGIVASYLVYKIIYRPLRFGLRWWRGKTPYQIQRNISTRLNNGDNHAEIRKKVKELRKYYDQWL